MMSNEDSAFASPAIAAEMEPIIPSTTTDSAPQGSPTTTWRGLTIRQASVLALLWKGGRRKDIARQLQISERTFDTHRNHALRHLGVTTEIAALVAAFYEGAARIDFEQPPEHALVLSPDVRWGDLENPA